MYLIFNIEKKGEDALVGITENLEEAIILMKQDYDREFLSEPRDGHPLTGWYFNMDVEVTTSMNVERVKVRGSYEDKIRYIIKKNVQDKQ